MLDRYKTGKDEYKDYLSKNKFGSMNKVANAEVRNQASAGFAKMYENTNSTNANSSKQMLDSYMQARNKTHFAVSAQEAKQNTTGQASLRANRFNQLRFLDSIDASEKARKDFGDSLARSFKYNDEDMEGVYEVS